MNIESLDKMQDALAQYHMSNIGDIELFKRIIEMHEENKPKPEPVAYMAVFEDGSIAKLCRNETIAACWGLPYQPLYTTQPTREPLSEEQINALRIEVSKEHAVSRWLFHLIIRLTELAHGIGV